MFRKSLDYILSQMDRTHILTPCKIILNHFNIILQFMFICPKKYVSFSFYFVKLYCKVLLQKNLQS